MEEMGRQGETQIYRMYFSSLKSLLSSKAHTTFTKYSGMKTLPSVHYKTASSAGKRRT